MNEQQRKEIEERFDKEFVYYDRSIIDLGKTVYLNNLIKAFIHAEITKQITELIKKRDKMLKLKIKESFEMSLIDRNYLDEVFEIFSEADKIFEETK